MGIHNYMENIVEEVLNDILSEREDICKCEKCKLDMKTWALNRLPPKYVVTQKGRVYTKLQEISIQFKTDVTREVTRAVEQIRSKPQH